MPATAAVKRLSRLAHLIQTGEVESPASGPLKVGVDLGTANIVLAVLDAEDNPVAGASARSRVVKDGIVVDYLGAVEVVRRLREDVEKRLGQTLPNTACTGIPPGILDGNTRVITNVVEAADFIVNRVVDEPSAAALVLGIKNGAVVDVGGGTTGISILEKGKVIFTDDEPTGGTHMTLVVAGGMNLSFEEAEDVKLDPTRQRLVFPMVKPVVEKMASIVNRCLTGHKVKEIYVVGGACTFDDFEKVFAKATGLKVIKAPEPLLVTPLGIAMSSEG